MSATQKARPRPDVLRMPALVRQLLKPSTEVSEHESKVELELPFARQSQVSVLMTFVLWLAMTRFVVVAIRS